MQSLNTLNAQLAAVLSQLEAITAEDEKADELVSNLLDLVYQRQLLLNELLESPKEEDRQVLQTQLTLTNQFTARAVPLLKHRQELLHLGRKSQKQLNVYKSIGSE